MENIQFASKEHKTFYTEMLATTRNDDAYHKVLFYTMGISAETRHNIRSLFDFKGDGIKPEGLSTAWQTGSTRRLCRLAFNSGMAGQRKVKNSILRLMIYLTAGLLPIFLKRSGCAIRNIAGVWDVPP